jgi:hypothetical protein
MEPSPSEFYEDVHSRVRRIQLVFHGDEPYAKYMDLVGRSVDAMGELFGAHTGHHHTEVLLNVSDLQPVRRR